MRELNIVRTRIANLFDQGNAEALDRIYLVMNKTIAELCIMRSLLSPTQAPLPEEPEEVLEMEESAPSTPKQDFTELK